MGGVAKTVKKAVSGVTSIFKPKIPEVKIPEPPAPPPPPAPPAPEPEVAATGEVRPENISGNKKKGRNSLRIDLNTGTSPVGNGVNIPRG